MSSFYLARIAEALFAIAKAINRCAKVEEEKLSAREEYLSHLTPAERLHENGLSSKDWVLNKDQQSKLVEKPGDKNE